MAAVARAIRLSAASSSPSRDSTAPSTAPLRPPYREEKRKNKRNTTTDLDLGHFLEALAGGLRRLSRRLLLPRPLPVHLVCAIKRQNKKEQRTSRASQTASSSR